MFLADPESTPESERLFADDEKYMGFRMNATTLWTYQPDSQEALFSLLGTVSAGLTMRQRGILVAAAASTLGDAYCSLAWGGKLARESDPDTAAAVLTGDDAGLEPEEAALARWARRVVDDPNATTAADVDDLRDHGFDDAQIFGITAFVALRLAFSTVNDALGSRPDAELRSFSPAAVVDAVTFGRPFEDVD